MVSSFFLANWKGAHTTHMQDAIYIAEHQSRHSLSFNRSISFSFFTFLLNKFSFLKPANRNCRKFFISHFGKNATTITARPESFTNCHHVLFRHRKIVSNDKKKEKKTSNTQPRFRKCQEIKIFIYTWVSVYEHYGIHLCMRLHRIVQSRTGNIQFDDEHGMIVFIWFAISGNEREERQGIDRIP